MSADNYTWTSLHHELDRWSKLGKTANFWWRDDDAAEETAQLQKLDALSQEARVPVSLAVIPAGLKASLVDFLNHRDNFIVLQHGYSHSSYAIEGAKKIELGGKRLTAEIEVDLIAGRRQLSTAFGIRFLPVLVPPWNRVESRIYSSLVNAGFTGLSTMWSRKTTYPASGILQVNTHLDPINWRQDRGFIGESIALGQICRHLSESRLAQSDIAEPGGVLTHHLIQNDEVWEFCKKLFETLNSHPAARWLNARDIWG